MSLNKSDKKSVLALVSPFVIILLGFLTAAICSNFIGGWSWVPLALVYWGSLGFCIIYLKEGHRVRDWLQRPKSSKGAVLVSLALGMFPLTILMTNYKLFDSILLIVLWLLFAVINPWFEELYWRGLLLDAAERWFPKWAAVLFSTILFVLSHPLMWGVFSIASTSYQLYLYLLIMGIIWSITYYKTRSLRWVILSHFVVDIGNLTVLTFLNRYVPPGM